MSLFYRRLLARTFRTSRVGYLLAGTLKAKPFHHSKRKCTDVYVRSKHGEPVHGRTLEFGKDLGHYLSAHPPGNEKHFLSPFGGNNFFQGLVGTNEYGYFAMNSTLSVLGKNVLPLSVDGVNEKGLSVGALYLPGFAQFEHVSNPDKSNNCILNLFMVDYLLGNFKTTGEIEEDLPTRHVWDLSQIFMNTKTVATVHFVVYDSSGRGITLEWVEGQLHINESIGVFTNSPPYPFHVLNSKQYIDTLSPVNPETVNYGQGFGLLGLPGDWTPPSRFVRAAVQRELMTEKETAAETVNSVAHIINTVDIMKGVALEKKKHAPKNVNPKQNPDAFTADHTQWSILKDIANNQMFYRLYDSLNWGVVKLNFEDLKGKPYNVLLPQNNPENPVNPLHAISGTLKTDEISQEKLQNLVESQGLA